MTDRDVYALIDRIIRDGKRRISERDSILMSQMLGAYQESRNVIAAELMMLEQQILWSIETGQGELTEAWVRRQAWYEQLDATIQRESMHLESVTRRLTTDGMAAGIAEGGVTGRATVQAAPWTGPSPAQPLERWVSAIQPGSPLDDVLSRYGSTVEESLRRKITQGIIQGRGSSNTTARIVAELGDAIPPSDASRIVRDQTMRTYRGTYRDQLDALPDDMITGYRKVAALDTRTCAICIGQHNVIYPEYPDDFHVQCRCSVAPVFSPRYAPPRDFETGEDWLRRQGEERHKQVLGSGERYEMWRDGMTLPEMIRIENDPVWGGSPRLIAVRDLRP